MSRLGGACETIWDVFTGTQQLQAWGEWWRQQLQAWEKVWQPQACHTGQASLLPTMEEGSFGTAAGYLFQFLLICVLD